MRTIGVVAGAMLAVLGGCASGERACDCGPECPVCRENADLACLHVKVNDQTPKAEYNGRTYYFCSEECRDAFLKNPRKYTGN